MRTWLAGFVLTAVCLTAVWVFSQQRSAARTLARTELALQRQVLASRFGMAAYVAEAGDYVAARGFASQAFDGIANYGIESGALPRDYAAALASRDDVIAMLATRQPGADERPMTLFYSLQIAVDTDLDPTHILPAVDSGLQLEPPPPEVSPRWGTRRAARRHPPATPGGPRSSVGFASRRTPDTFERYPRRLAGSTFPQCLATAGPR